MDSKEFVTPYIKKPIPVAVRSKAWVCGRLFAGIAGSNPAEGMDVCSECCMSVRRAVHSSRGVLSIVVCLSVALYSLRRGGLGQQALSSHEYTCIYIYIYTYIHT